MAKGKQKAGKGRKTQETKNVAPVPPSASAGGNGKRGRPTLYSEEIAAHICLQLTLGRTLNKICAAPDMPSRPTVMRWVVEDKDGFSDRYDEARRRLLDHWADETVDLADDCEAEPGKVSKARLQIDSRKWLLSKLAPQQYGDKLAVTDQDGGVLSIRMVA